MDKDYILVIIAVSIVTFIYGYIAYSIIKSKRKPKYYKSKEMIEIKQKEYECVVCKNKFPSCHNFKDNEPICSEKCVLEYIHMGNVYEVTGEEDNIWKDVFERNKVRNG